MKQQRTAERKPLFKRALSAAAALSMAAMMLPELPLLGAAGIDVYDLYVCGTRVTTENANNILGDNSCSYSSSDKYLYINKSLSAEGKSAEVIYNAGIEGLTIYYTNDPDTGEAPVLTPENGRGTIALEADTTLSGYTGLTIEQSAASISLFDAALTIEGTENLTVGCIVGASGVKSDSEINLTLRNADVTFTDAVSVPGSIVLENTKLRQSDYIIQNGHILDGEGNFATDAEFYPYIEYDLWVGGVQVTTDNQSDILGNGYFTFNPNMTELTIHKNAATGSNTYYAYGTGMDAAIVSEEWLSIYVQDDFTILTDEPAGIQIYNECEIKGPGKLTVNSRDTDAIQVLNSATLYLNDANVSAQSKYNALNGGGDMDPGYLYVWRSTLSAYSTGDDEAAICGFYGDIDLSCCRVKNDNVVQKDDGFYLDDESGDYAQTVNIIQTEYGLYVKSTCVTEDNCEDILGDGSTSYNPKTKTLTLTQDLTDEWCLISSELSGLTIEVVGDITLTVTNDDAVISGCGCTIIGDGSNTLTFDYLGGWAPAVMTYGGTLTIQDINVIGSVGTPGFFDEEFSSHHHEGPVTLNLVNAGLTAFPYGSSEEDRRSGVYGFNQIFFNDCTVLEPLRGQIIEGSIVDENGDPAKVVIGKISIELTAANVSLSGDCFPYTGSKVKPAVAVTVGDTVLTEGVDYTLGYSSNVNVGYRTAKAVISGIGAYAGTVRVPFTICPKKLAAPTLSFADGKLSAAWAADANAQAYEVIISKSATLNAAAKSTQTLVTTDTAASFEGPAAGETWYAAVRAVVSSNGKTTGTLYGVFSDTASAKLTQDITKAVFASGAVEYEYTGSAITPAMTVKCGSTVLTEGKDFTVTYANNKAVGCKTATATVTGIGNYSGTITKKFTVVPATQAAPTVTVQTGGGLKVKWTKDASADAYEVIWSKSATLNAAAKSTASAVYTGVTSAVIDTPALGETWYVAVRAVVSSDGTANGTLYGFNSEIVKVTLTNDITKAVFASGAVEYAYTGKQVKPEMTVKCGSTVLTEGVDYTVTYANNKAVGYKTATATVTGIGKYAGTITKKFTIVPATQAAPAVKATNSGKLWVKWAEDANAIGYEVVISKSATLNPSAKSTVSAVFEAGTTTNTFAQPASGETWYVAVRAVISDDGTTAGTLYGNYSEIVKIKMP